MALLMTVVGKRLAENGYWWATGGSGNADRATMEINVKGHVYVPWPNFEGMPQSWAIPKIAFKTAEQYCPLWHKFSDGLKKLHARNMMIIAGPHIEIEDAVDLVLCYTRDGCHNKATRSPQTGGTGSAIAYADDLGIPVINLANANALELLTIFTQIDFTDIVVNPMWLREVTPI